MAETLDAFQEDSVQRETELRDLQDELETVDDLNATLQRRNGVDRGLATELAEVSSEALPVGISLLSYTQHYSKVNLTITQEAIANQLRRTFRNMVDTLISAYEGLLKWSNLATVERSRDKDSLQEVFANAKAIFDRLKLLPITEQKARRTEASKEFTQLEAETNQADLDFIRNDYFNTKLNALDMLLVKHSVQVNRMLDLSISLASGKGEVINELTTLHKTLGTGLDNGAMIISGDIADNERSLRSGLAEFLGRLQALEQAPVEPEEFEYFLSKLLKYHPQELKRLYAPNRGIAKTVEQIRLKLRSLKEVPLEDATFDLVRESVRLTNEYLNASYGYIRIEVLTYMHLKTSVRALGRCANALQAM